MLDRLTESVAAVCPVDGVSGDRDGVTVQYRAEATAGQRAAADAAVAAFDWSAGADAAWRLGRASVAAVAWLASSTDAAAVALRVVLRDLYTAVNDERESRGLPRVLEPAIAHRLVAAAQAGAGAPIPLE